MSATKAVKNLTIREISEVKGLSQMIDAIQKTAATERSKYHLTLAEFIDVLESLPAETEVVFDTGDYLGGLASYRGYYSDLAFSVAKAPTTVGSALKMCKTAVGRTFQGYKGGDFIMTADTPLWMAEWGCLGSAIIFANTVADGRLVLKTKEV